MNEPQGTSGEASYAALIAHLAGRSLSATYCRLTADSSNIHDPILPLAAENSADLIAMGGYGHSRLHDSVLGGTSRGMFKSLTVPH